MENRDLPEGILSLNMKTARYDSFEEWYEDLLRVRSAPNNQQLIEIVKRKTNASEEALRSKIKIFLQEAALESNPREVFSQVSRDNPKCFILVNEEDNPWFSA